MFINIIVKSHVNYSLQKRFVTCEKRKVLNGLKKDNPNNNNKSINEIIDEQEIFYQQQIQANNFIPLEAKSGSLILLHGNNIHMSYQNLSNKSRHAYTLHAIDGATNWS